MTLWYPVGLQAQGTVWGQILPNAVWGARDTEHVYRVLTSGEIVAIMDALVAIVPTGTRWRKLGGIFGRCKRGGAGKFPIAKELTLLSLREALRRRYDASPRQGNACLNEPAR